MIKLSVIGAEEFRHKLSTIQNELRGPAVRSGLLAAGHYIEGVVVQNILNWAPHLVDTGAMIGSVTTFEPEVTGSGGRIEVGPTVEYAGIQEYGGTIVAKPGRFLSWIDKETGKRIFAKKVTIPARPFLRPAADEHGDDAAKAFSAGIDEMVRRAK